jgi:Xaa-Pro aminopeptidase
MDAQNIAQRVRGLRDELGRRSIDAVVLTKPANVTYLTGFSGEDSWAVVAKGAVYLLTDSRYTEQAEKECPLAKIVQRKDSMAQAAGRLMERLKAARTVAVEKSISLAQYQALRKHTAVRLRAVDDLVENRRSVKDKSELAAIRSAAAVAATAFQRAMRHVRPGITESMLAGILDLEMRRQGAKIGFETIVAFGPNASRPHHQPSPRKLAETDTILIDFGARYNGYCCDITRSFAFGKPTAAYCRAYEIVEKAQAAAIGMARAGAELAQVDAAARKAIRETGLPVYGHGTGHGFGLEIHEIPFLKEKAKGKLQAGQIITIEPGVYLPGKLGVRLEDDILITDDGCELLTGACPRKSPLEAVGRK